MLLNLLLAVLSGLLLFAIHPKFSLTLLAPVAIAPLLIALAREGRPKYRALFGFISGVVFWAGVNYWIQYVLATHGGMPVWLSYVAFILFCILKAIHLTAFGLLAPVLMQTRWALIGVPALWTGLERVPGFFNYTWLVLGNAGTEMVVPLRLVPWTGVYGISFIFAMLGTGLALVVLRRSRKELLWLLAALVPFLVPPLPEAESPARWAVSVQPNIEDREDWTTQQASEIQQMLEYLSLSAALAPNKSPVPLILWPEVPAPVYYFEDTPFRDRLNNMARLARAHVIIGTVAHNEKGAPLNSALWVSPQGAASGRYDKMFPVPFGEYIPFPFGGLVEKVSNEVGNFEPGKRVVVFEAGEDKVGPFICYESAFPSLVRRFASAGATVFVNLSNDGYFGRTAAREQHMQLVRMRAVENARWILRSTNDGLTAAIDPAGRVVQTLEPFKQLAGRLGYNSKRELTFYSKLGDVFAWCCLVLATILLVVSQFPHYTAPGRPIYKQSPRSTDPQGE